MSQTDLRQEKSYRRGLILGLTIAEIMILLIFVLLMALTAALSERDETIDILDNNGANEIIKILKAAYPQSTKPDDFFKELVRAIEVRKIVDENGFKAAGEQWKEDAEFGARVRAAAASAGMDPSIIENFFDQARNDKKGKWPPFFNLSEADGYYFDSGKATLRPEFKENLKIRVIPKLAENIREYDVDVVEVIGHTDEVPMVGRSNLDSQLISASTGKVDIGNLRSTDNAGLAIARAVSVVQLLRADPSLKRVAILPLSAAQMIVPTDKLADGTSAESNQSRRRIEIRLRRSTQVDDVNAVRVVK